jgi:ATP-dependent Lon protease
VLFVEATDFPGTGNLTITGQLGDVMKESAQAALSFVRAHASELNPDLPEDYFQEHDLHVHVPAGAIPKDGPSAGVTMATALASLISRRPVRHDTAMTGELTLTGQVLPIGGLKEKALAAQDAGLERVIAPKLNEQDVEDIPEHLRKDLEFVFVERIEQVLEEALLPAASGPNGTGPDGRAARKPATAGDGARARRPARPPARARATGAAVKSKRRRSK